LKKEANKITEKVAPVVKVNEKKMAEGGFDVVTADAKRDQAPRGGRGGDRGGRGGRGGDRPQTARDDDR